MTVWGAVASSQDCQPGAAGMQRMQSRPVLRYWGVYAGVFLLLPECARLALRFLPAPFSHRHPPIAPVLGKTLEAAKSVWFTIFW